MKLIFLALLTSLAVSLPAYSAQPFYSDKAELPKACKSFFAWRCYSDSRFEMALEQEFWSYLGNGEYKQLKEWSARTKKYVYRAKHMRNDIKARLKTFIAFAHVGLYVQKPIFDPLNLTNVLKALAWSSSAMKLDPDSANLQSLHYYLLTYMGFALSKEDVGEHFIGQLQNITDQYGPVVGSEGELVGAMSRMLLKDPAQVAHGLEILNDCHSLACQRDSSLAPFKEVGMQIAIAEGYARLGDIEKMNAAYQLAKDYAEQHQHPYPELIEQMQQAMVGAGGVLSQWQTSNKGLGDIKLPLPPSAGASACQVCHASGSQTLNHYQ